MMEKINDSTAKQLLGSNYREGCDYSISFTDEGILVIRIDKSFCVDEVVEKDGVVIDGYTMAFKIENDDLTNSNIESYDEMVKSVNEEFIPKKTDYNRDIYSIYEQDKTPVTTKIIIGVICALLLCSMYLWITLTH